MALQAVFDLLKPLVLALELVDRDIEVAAVAQLTVDLAQRLDGARIGVDHGLEVDEGDVDLGFCRARRAGDRAHRAVRVGSRSAQMHGTV